jgi:hypothetical protein
MAYRYIMPPDKKRICSSSVRYILLSEVDVKHCKDSLGNTSLEDGGGACGEIVH